MSVDVILVAISMLRSVTEDFSFLYDHTYITNRRNAIVKKIRNVSIFEKLFQGMG